MKTVIESADNWQNVMFFIGQNIDYSAAYLPNLPMWGAILSGEVPDMKLIVASQYNDENGIIACAVRQVFTGDLAAAKAINPDFSPVSYIGDFGEVSEALGVFAEQTAKAFVRF